MKAKVSPRSSLGLLQKRHFTDFALSSLSDFTSELQQVWILGSLQQTADGVGKEGGLLGSKAAQLVSNLIGT